MQVLIAGGAGFIGSTIASACVDAGISPVIIDNLGTGRREFTTGRAFYQGDIADGALIDRIFADHPGIQTPHRPVEPGPRSNQPRLTWAGQEPGEADALGSTARTVPTPVTSLALLVKTSLFCPPLNSMPMSLDRSPMMTFPVTAT